MRLRHALTLPLTVALLLLAVPLPALAQETAVVTEGTDEEWSDLDSFGEEISVEVVNLDVRVLDRQGRPVTGLTQDDFALYQDGEPVELSNFAAFEGSVPGAAAEPDPNAQPGEPPKERFTLEVSDEPANLEAREAREVPEENRLHLAVLVDNRSLRPADRARVFLDMREFLAGNLQEGDRVAIAVNHRGLQLVQRFTDDPAAVVRTLDRIEKLATSGIQIDTERRSALAEIKRAMVEAVEVAAAAGEPPCRFAFGQMQGAAERYASVVQAEVHSSAGALATLSKTLSGVPGSKVVLYVGNGLAQTPGMLMFEYIAELCPDQRSLIAGFQQQYDVSWVYEEVAARANAAGVTLYTLEAASPAIDLGLDSPDGGSQSQAGGRTFSGSGSSQTGGLGAARGELAQKGPTVGRRFQPSTQSIRLEDQDEESSLVLLASETGGRSFLNAADFTADFQHFAADMRNYYSLGFVAPEKGAGEPHRLEVKVKGGEGYRVHHRLRYRSKPLAERMVERIQGIAQFGLGENPLEARVEIGEALPQGDAAYRVPVRIWVPLEKLTLVEAAQGKREGKVRVLMTTTDAKGNLLPVRQKEVPIKAGVAPGASGPVGEQLVEVELTLPEGSHHVALAVRDELGGEVSYLRERFQVPVPQVAARSEGQR